MKQWLINFFQKYKFGIWPALLWLVISFILLTLPGSAFPKETWLTKIYFDKWVHIGMFAILTFLFCKFTIENNIHTWKIWLFIIATLSTLYGLGMEYVQRDFVQNRSFDWYDVLADFTGSVLGLILAILLVQNLKRLEK